MKEQLISFETAKLAKEKGFKCNSSDCSWAYLNTNGMAMSYDEKSCVLIPTQSLLQKWLREKHDLHLCVGLDRSLIEEPNYNYQLINHSQTVDYSETNFKTYEEALEKGLYEALKLIK